MVEFSQLDYRFMSRALRLAEQGRFSAHPNPMVGCVLVKEGKVIGEGWHLKPGQAHAEVNALKQAENVRYATAYVTLEPCCHHGRTGPCTEALIAAGVSRVVCAMKDPFVDVAGQGIAQLKQAGIQVDVGLMQEQAEELNRGFLSKVLKKRPYVRCKMAMTLDGRTAAADGSSQWITSPQARCDVHKLRAQSAAIMTGIGTVLYDDPSLTVRGEDEQLKDLLKQAYFEQPKRIVVDSEFQFPSNASMRSLPGETWVFTLNSPKTAAQAGLKVIRGERDADGRVNLQDMMRQLAANDINSVFVEAGATLSGALLAEGLVDEWLIYMAPKFLGDEGKGLVSLPGLRNISQHIGLEITDVRVIGPDLRVTARPKQKE